MRYRIARLLELLCLVAISFMFWLAATNGQVLP